MFENVYFKTVVIGCWKGFSNSVNPLEEFSELSLFDFRKILAVFRLTPLLYWRNSQGFDVVCVSLSAFKLLLSGNILSCEIGNWLKTLLLFLAPVDSSTVCNLFIKLEKHHFLFVDTGKGQYLHQFCLHYCDFQSPFSFSRDFSKILCLVRFAIDWKICYAD